ncbi:MAG TPA: cytidylate kinase-like family protein [Usitatibacter sp.]|nr:cytidylate kinase-like family protein [Usitatibacter sp.]
MPVIAMTREMGSLGKDVAAGYAARTNSNVVYHEIIEPVANKMRLRKSHVERFIEGKAGLWERLTTDRTSLSIYTAEETFRLLRDPATGVIRGWGAAHLLKDVPHVIRVRVCSPFETRVERMMERLGTDHRAAVEKEIRMSEEAHTAIVRRHFGVDWRDPQHYHLVLCTENLSVARCIDQIEFLAQQVPFQRTAETERIVENLALEASVRAALRCDSRTSQVSVVIQCADGIAKLLGMVPDANAAQAANDVAASVSGVRRVQNELRATGVLRSRYLREA